MPILYKKAKQAVDRQYDQLVAAGYTPVLNADKESYSWINKATGAKYYGTDPIGGIDAESGVGDILKRNRRQRRLMSEKAGAAAKEAAEASRIKQDKDATASANKGSEGTDQSKGSSSGSGTQAITREAKLSVPGGGIVGLGVNVLNTVPQLKSQLAEKSVVQRKEDSDVSFYTGQVDVSTPYLYVSDADFEKVKGRLSFGDRLGRPLPVPTMQLRRGRAQAEHAGMTGAGLGIGESMGEKIPYEIRKGGKHYRLLPNPDFIDRTYELTDLDKIKQIYGDNVVIDKVEIDGKPYLKVNKDFGKKFFDVTSGILAAGAYQKVLSVLPGTKKLFKRKPKAGKATTPVEQPGEGWDDLIEHGSEVYKNGGKIRFNFVD